METTCRIAGLQDRPRKSQGKSQGKSRVIVRVFDLLAAWAERRRQRLALGSLNDTQLRDIGLSRADVDGEIGKPFWMG